MLGALLLPLFVQTVPLLDLQQVRVQEYKKIQAVRDKIRLADPKASLFPPAILETPEIKAMGLGSPEGAAIVQQALSYRFESSDLADFHPVDFTSKDPVLSYAAARIQESGQPTFQTFKQAFEGQSLAIYLVKVTQIPLPVPAAAQPATGSTMQEYLGPLTHADLLSELKYLQDHGQPGVAVRTKAEEVPGEAIPVSLYDNARGDVLVVLGKVPPQPLVFPFKKAGSLSTWTTSNGRSI
jgi:hypothetical protein